MQTELLNSIVHPTILLDELKCKNNILQMLQKANKYNLALRPHFKTHQSAQIGKWFSDLGVEEITVSSMHMAEYFVGHGWQKIILAFPANTRALKQINSLAEKCSLTLLLSDKMALSALISRVEQELSFFIEIDTGYNRTGFKAKEQSNIRQIIELASKSDYLNFRGFYVHNGHTYKANGESEVSKIHIDAIKQLRQLRKAFSSYPKLEVQLGDTPSCSTMEHFEYIDAICPGNFVFYDLTQANIGSCSLDDIAIVVACPVVAKNPESQSLTIHGGAVHFSKDKLEVEGRTIYGRVVEFYGASWGKPIENTYISALSQEHGTIKASKDFYEKTAVGDLVFVMPVHSCLTANLHSQYLTTSGQRIVRMPRV